MNNKIMILLLGMFMLSFAIAQNSDIGQVAKGECIDLYNWCDSCTYINLTGVYYPNATINSLNESMTKNGINYNYTFCDTDALGKYSYTTCGDKDGTFQCEVIDFESTPTGAANISEGQGVIAITSTFIILIVSGLFLFFYTRAQAIGWKVVTLGTAVTMLFIAVLQSMVLVDQNLGVYSSLVDSYAGFLLVMKIMFGIAILVLLLFTLYKAYMSWQLKRGFRDE